MRIRQLVILAIFCHAFICRGLAQDIPDSNSASVQKITQKYISAVDSKAAKVSGSIDKQTEKYLAKLEKQEMLLQNKLSKIDSIAANNVFANTKTQYDELRNKIKNKGNQLKKSTGRYFPWADSAATSLQFLSGKNSLIGNVNGNAAKIQGALSKVKELENQFKQAENIKDFIRQRKEMIAAQLKNYSLGNELKKYNQTAYYYTQQINEYRQVLDDPDKAERKALELLHKIPAFEKFMHEHGALAGLFDVPQDYATNMTGLQTRDEVQSIMQERIQNIGPNAQADVQQSIGEAQAELTKLRNRFPASGSVEDMPDFKPKEQKTKTFLKRLEYGTNIQTVRSNYYFPTTSDIALSVGYKLGEKNIIGVGASYKMGWGKDIQHIAISSQGVGFRSFADIRLKGSFFVSGGFEYNYQQPFNSMRELYDLNTWQQSGLLGISKIISLKTKFFKKTKLQVLWDMLSYQQVPQTQALKFRVGYSFLNQSYMKIMRVFIGGLIFIMLYSNSLLSQTNESNIENLKNVVPPSPNASSLGKYTDWPVSLYTGVPSISIPIYELKGRNLSIPISLNYHAAGNKVGDIASQVGLGWSLNAGGMVSRSVKGLPDDISGLGYFSKRQSYSDPDNLNSTASEANYKTHAVAAAQNNADAEPDVYSFNIMGKSYKMLFKADGTILTIPHSAIKVSTNAYTTTINDEDAYWQLILEDGTKCIFGGANYYETNTNPRFGNLAGINHYTSSWYLKTITSASGEVVTFTYTNSLIDQDSYFSESDNIRYGTSFGTPNQCELMSELGTSSKAERQQVTQLSLNTIESDLTRVDFVLSATERLDLKGSKSLDQINIYSKSKGDYIEKNKFNYTYSQAVVSYEMNAGIQSVDLGYYQNRLKLNSVEKRSIDNATLNKWVLAYNTQNLPSRRSYAQDHWGFFNGAVSNSTLLPTYYYSLPNTFFVTNDLQHGFFPGLHDLGANREGNEPAMQAEMLTDITFPTGGKTSFQYEANSVPVNEEQFTTQSVHAELNLTSLSNPYLKTVDVPFTITTPQYVNFQVSGAAVSAGILNDMPGAYVKAKITCASGACMSLPVLSQISSTWMNLRTTGNYVLTVYTNADQESFGNTDYIQISANVIFKQSTGFTIINKSVGGLRIRSIVNYDAVNTAATLKKYYQYEDPLILDPVNIKDNYIAEQNEQKCSTLPGGGTDQCYYHRVVRNSSTKFAAGSIEGGTVGYGKVTTLYGPTGENGKTVSIFSSVPDINVDLSKVFPYPPPETREWRRGKLLKETTYNSQAVRLVEKTDSFSYTPVKTITAFKAGYETLVSGPGLCNCNDAYEYCNIQRVFYSVSTEQVKHINSTQTLWDQNGLNPQTTTTNYFYDNPNNLQATRTETNDSKNNIIKTILRTALEKSDINAATALTTTASAAIDQMVVRNIISPVIQTEKYNGSLLASRSLVNYKVWPNNIVLPENAQLQVGSNAPEMRVQFHNYDNAGNLLEQSKLNDVHEVYLYGYNKQYPVAKILNSTFVIANGLVTQSVLDNPTDDASLRLHLNNLRSIPGALVTTYTYEPLIGMTSETDPNGKTIFYEYDNFNRLKNIKDYQGNIVKNFQYNYANSCGNNCVVLPMQTFTAYNTPSYPVGVFNGSKQYIGTANNPAQYVSLWNSNAANQAIGILSTNTDSMHFNLSLATNATAPPVVYGLRYFQWDVFTSTLVQINTDSLSFIDWGDGSTQLVTQLRTSMTESIPYGFTNIRNDFMYYSIWINHTYASNQPRTITIFHNETTECVGFSNYGVTDLQDANIRGYYPEKVKGIAYNFINSSSDLGVKNFSTLKEVIHAHYFFTTSEPVNHNKWQSINNFHKLKWLKIDYAYGGEIAGNFRVNFPDLVYFDLKKFKPDINQIWGSSSGGFPNLYVYVHHLLNETFTTAEADLILNSMAGANTINSGKLQLYPYPQRSSASDAAYATLIARFWNLILTNP